MKGAKAFFDTNVLLYMHGGDDAGKRSRARELVGQYVNSSRFLLSTQVVQEFYAVALRKGMPRRQLREATAVLLDLPLVIIRPAHIRSAIDNEEKYNISFWDALILAAAESGGAELLYTEDLKHGQRYGTVLVRNPFRPPFVD